MRDMEAIFKNARRALRGSSWKNQSSKRLRRYKYWLRQAARWLKVVERTIRS